MNKYLFLFCHGWGCNKDFFNPIIYKYFYKKNFICIDLGYFNQKNINFSNIKNYSLIGIGHSLGLIKLLSFKLNFKALIGIQSFINFIGSNPLIQKKRKLELYIMTKSFCRYPKKTLLSFYKKCRIDYLSIPLYNYNKEELYKDLTLISNCNVTINYDFPILIIGSENDEIVPIDIIYDNFTVNQKIVIHKSGYHNLIKYNCNFVYKQIIKFLYEI